MMTEKLILSDCDGVMLDWNTSFEYFMYTKGHHQFPDTDNSFSIATRFNISNQVASDYIKEFNTSEYISKLLPLKHSIKYVSKLVDDGFRFVCITSIGDDEITKVYRKHNLTKLYGDVFDDIICLPMGSNKEECLSQWKNTEYYWLEDHTKNAVDGHNLGLKPILVGHPYNNFDQLPFPRYELNTAWENIYKEISNNYSV